jgi:energy-coupling factor transport system permease protein
MVLIIGSSIFLTYTTTPIQLTDGIEQLFGFLKVIKVSVHEFAMMTSIALRFIPTLVEETEKIISAQKARGADFTSGGLIKRAKTLVPILVPLFISAFRRADELAVAMECRCYRGGDGRTKLHVLKYRFSDFIMIFSGLVFLAGIILINYFEIDFSFVKSEWF